LAGGEREGGGNENKNEGKGTPGFVQKEEPQNPQAGSTCLEGKGKREKGRKKFMYYPVKRRNEEKKRGKVKLTTHPHVREKEGNWLSL